MKIVARYILAGPLHTECNAAAYAIDVVFHSKRKMYLCGSLYADKKNKMCAFFHMRQYFSKLLDQACPIFCCWLEKQLKQHLIRRKVTARTVTPMMIKGDRRKSSRISTVNAG